MKFVAIDVETANSDMASICQIGLVRYKDGALSDEWSSLVDPQDYFDEINESIHGISESHIEGAPTFAELNDTLCSYLDGEVVVCHTHFDRVAICQAAHRHGVAKTLEYFTRDTGLERSRTITNTGAPLAILSANLAVCSRWRVTYWMFKGIAPQSLGR